MDQSAQECGIFQPGFGFVDTCTVANINNVSIQASERLEWDQTTTTFYTGQLMNISWQYENIQADELITIRYQGQNTRTLSSGTNITTGFFSARLSDSNNAPSNGAVPVSLAAITSTSIADNSQQLISVVQSRLTNIQAYDGTRLLGTGSSGTTMAGQNITINWRNVGQPQLGFATITVRSGGGTTVGSPLTNIPCTGNMSINYVMPRSFNPSGLAQYSAQISVSGPNGPYTGNSQNFGLSSAPSTSPTPTSSTTPSRTPTPTSSETPSVTPSSSVTPTPTSSITPSGTPTPSTTPTAIDLGAIGRAAAAAVDTTTPIIGAVVGTLVAVGAIVVGYSVYQRKVLTDKRQRRLAATGKTIEDRSSIYHVNDGVATNPTIVMYQVNSTLPHSSKQSLNSYRPSQKI